MLDDPGVRVLHLGKQDDRGRRPGALDPGLSLVVEAQAEPVVERLVAEGRELVLARSREEPDRHPGARRDRGGVGWWRLPGHREAERRRGEEPVPEPGQSPSHHVDHGRGAGRYHPALPRAGLGVEDAVEAGPAAQKPAAPGRARRVPAAEEPAAGQPAGAFDRRPDLDPVLEAVEHQALVGPAGRSEVQDDPHAVLTPLDARDSDAQSGVGPFTGVEAAAQEQLGPDLPVPAPQRCQRRRGSERKRVAFAGDSQAVYSPDKACQIAAPAAS